jgi:Skp family chaperone for outer membrane proteins
MKTTALAVLSALLMSAAGPVFAMSHQEQLACVWTAGNCLDRGKLLEQRIMEIKNEIKKNANGSSEEAKILEKKLQDARDELKRLENES